MEISVLKKSVQLYDSFFDQLYLYFARRVRTKRLVGFLLQSVFQQILENISSDSARIFTLPDLYRISWEFLSKELEKSFGQQKTHERPSRIQFFDDVYRLRNRESEVKSQRFDQTFERSPELELFYSRLLPLEREVLQLSVFEGLSDASRALVLNMNESDCTQLFYATLKKAKDLLDQASAHQKIPERFVPYFGNLLKLFQKIREEEYLPIDQELKASLRKELFPGEVFSSVSEIPSAQAFEVEKKSDDRISALSPAPISEEPSGASLEWEDVSEPFSVRGLFRRFQGVFLLMLILPLAIGLYFFLYSQNSQVKRLLADSRVLFETRFSDEEKDRFIREALLYLVKRRDFTRVEIEKLNGKRLVFFELKSGLREKFIIAPHVKPWPWQTREYRQIKSL